MTEFAYISTHWIALGAAIILTSVAQVLLRAGAKSEKRSLPLTFLNHKVLVGNLIFFLVVLLMIFAMQEITLRTATALNSITYVLVPLMAHKFVKDPYDLRTIIGSMTIVFGILVFLV